MKKLLFLSLALVAADASAAFRCVDEKGSTHFGDTPPAACAKVPMYEISRSGTVLRKIDPTPSAEELKVREAESAERREREKALAEQRRKDMALLSTYSTAAEFDMARDRNVEPVQGRIKSAQERIVAVDKRAQDLQQEMEFYKAGKSKSKKSEARDVPAQLVADHDRVLAEKAALARSIAGYEKEIAEIRQKFEVDKRRWVELKSNPGLLRADAPPPAPTPGTLPVNASRGSVKCGDKTVNCRKGESFLCLKQDGTWHTVTCEAKS